MHLPHNDSRPSGEAASMPAPADADGEIADGEPNPQGHWATQGPGYGAFYWAAALHLMGSAVAFGLLVVSPSLRSDPNTRWGIIVLAVALIPLGSLFLVWPALAALGRAKVEAVRNFPAAMLEANTRMADLETARREHGKARIAVESAKEAVEALSEAVLAEKDQFLSYQQQLQRDLKQLVLDRRQIDDQLAGLRQERGNLARQIEQWQDAAVGFFQTLELTLSHASLPDKSREAYEKMVEAFTRAVRPLGVDPIRPSADEPFDERVHRVEGQEESDAAAPGHVLRCASWGFRAGSGSEPAGVILAKAKPRVEKVEVVDVGVEKKEVETVEKVEAAVDEKAADAVDVISGTKEVAEGAKAASEEAITPDIPVIPGGNSDDDESDENEILTSISPPLTSTSTSTSASTSASTPPANPLES